MCKSQKTCTGLTARWCPVCGNCTCADGKDLDDDTCPLHGGASRHAQAAPDGTRRLELTIRCGERTCAAAPKQFCPYFGTRKFGQVPMCRLFPTQTGSATVLEEQDGWTQRCQACLDSEKPAL